MTLEAISKITGIAVEYLEKGFSLLVNTAIGIATDLLISIVAGTISTLIGTGITIGSTLIMSAVGTLIGLGAGLLSNAVSVSGYVPIKTGEDPNGSSTYGYFNITNELLFNPLMANAWFNTYQLDPGVWIQ